MVYLPMKRSSREAELDSAISNMANCLMLLSSRGPLTNEPYDNSPSRVFECKTCNRQFPSFQALGGHRASHKRPRVNNDGDSHGTNVVPTKPKSHECSICGLEFAIGQALGGHMRRHRSATTTTNDNQSSDQSVDLSNSVVKNVSSRRVFSLDLNLTPLENDLESRFEKVVPTTIELFV